ncbi:hypothetical protein BRADI_3g45196v3 [Brachypodium distachyon]|uniref:Uncharacterized protein n=1 Tax=Brachypodium distachyon TaxID=15368 RepID=A0A2K2D3D0_BRADI|nr:hypothetical protein BRADI_3g45196v3 [Brachypodium distachyon]
MPLRRSGQGRRPRPQQAAPTSGSHAPPAALHPHKEPRRRAPMPQATRTWPPQDGSGRAIPDPAGNARIQARRPRSGHHQQRREPPHRPLQLLHTSAARHRKGR